MPIATSRLSAMLIKTEHVKETNCPEICVRLFKRLADSWVLQTIRFCRPLSSSSSQFTGTSQLRTLSAATTAQTDQDGTSATTQLLILLLLTLLLFTFLFLVLTNFLLLPISLLLLTPPPPPPFFSALTPCSLPLSPFLLMVACVDQYSVFPLLVPALSHWSPSCHSEHPGSSKHFEVTTTAPLCLL